MSMLSLLAPIFIKDSGQILLGLFTGFCLSVCFFCRMTLKEFPPFQYFWNGLDRIGIIYP